MAEALLKTVIHFGVIAIDEPDNYEARANLMWSSSWAINDTLTWGKPVAWTIHPMEHELSAYYDITHGAGLAILTPYWMEYVLSDKTVDKFAQYGVNVWDIDKNMDKYDIAKEAEFFCFGTNDLTQMTFGFSRDDAGKFLPAYYANKIYESDPFSRLDTVGVGKLMKMAVELGRTTRPELHCGICGEHGGDPSSIEFCHEIGLDYVSCSPFRVPIARLAAAQANIKNPRK